MTKDNTCRCPTCKGTGRIRNVPVTTKACPRCGGDGWITQSAEMTPWYEWEAPCPECVGTGEVYDG